MADDVLLNKAATVERCVARSHAEYAHSPTVTPRAAAAAAPPG